MSYKLMSQGFSWNFEKERTGMRQGSFKKDVRNGVVSSLWKGW